MARNNSAKESCWEKYCNSDQQEEEEEEALSLSDLPVVNLIINEDHNQPKREEAQTTSTNITKDDDEEFDFLGASFTTEPEMCAADDVFFKGQILPLRLSVSSDSGLAGFRQDSRNPSRCLSRSESMEHGSLGGFRSTNTSRSSSIGSHTSSTTTNSTATKTYKSKVRNQFHTHPSPKPQIKLSRTRLSNAGNRSQKSTIWGLFRLSLVHTPEIELKDLKVRSKNSTSKDFGSRNSSSSSNSNSSTKNLNGNADKPKRRPRFLGGCKCSVNSVEPVASNIVIIKSNTRTSPIRKDIEIKEKLPELKKMKQQQGKKQAMSRHRTFEWLKELSHAAGDPDES